MIHDSLPNHTKHHQAAKGLSKAFQFLTETDLANTPLGTYKIDGDAVFAIVMEYTTKPQPSCIQEAHYKYIDVHYIISGAEDVGLTKLTNQTPEEVNKEKDYAFYKCPVSLHRLQKGDFMVLFPEDIHQTGIQLDEPAGLKKVVVKVIVQPTDE